MAVLLLLLTLGGLAVTAVGYYGLVGKLKPNPWAGIRTPYTMSSPERWYATHRAGSPLLIFGGIAVISAGLAFTPFAFAGKVSDGLATGVAIACAIILLLTAVGSWIFGVSKAKAQVG